MPFPSTILFLLASLPPAPAAQAAGGDSWPVWSTRALRADVPHWPLPFDPAAPFTIADMPQAQASLTLEPEPVVAVGEPQPAPSLVFLWPEPPPSAPDRAASLRRRAALDATCLGLEQLGDLLAEIQAELEALAAARGVLVERIELDAPASEHPRHAHELALALATRLSVLAELEQVQALPAFASEPKPASARDTHLVLSLVRETVAALAQRRGIEAADAPRTADGVLAHLVCLHALVDAAGRPVTAGEVEAQLARSAADARGLLRRSDPAGRYRVTVDGRAGDGALRQRIDDLRARLTPGALPRLVAEEGSLLAAYLSGAFLVAEGNERKHAAGSSEPTPWASGAGGLGTARALASCELLWGQVPLP